MTTVTVNETKQEVSVNIDQTSDQVNVDISQTVQQINVNAQSVVNITVQGWALYALHYEPSTETPVTGGTVIQYDSDTQTVFRFVPEPYNYDQDGFYSGFDGVTLSRLLTTRK